MVAQLFCTQIKKAKSKQRNKRRKNCIVDELKYVGFTRINKLSLKPTVNRCVNNRQKLLGQLKWLKTEQCVSTKR